MSDRITVESGSRLHFGLWGWGPQYERQFGGVGMMVAQPRVKLLLAPSDRFTVVGPATERVHQVAEGCAKYWGWDHLPACRIEVVELPRQHVGLGVGTQLDLCVARGLAAWQAGKQPGLAELALAVDRGGRSSVGAFGFDLGGLVVEGGRAPGETPGKLLHRTSLPDEWRIILMTPPGKQGLSGPSEKQAFADLPSVPREVHDRLVAIACDQLVPAAREKDFERFAENLYAYGHLAGECYATVQEIPYHSREALELVERLRGEGVAGVAQSSWGPTLFALLPSQEKAQEVAELVKSWYHDDALQVNVVPPLNTGAQLTRPPN